MKTQLTKLLDDLADYGRQWREKHAGAWDAAMKAGDGTAADQEPAATADEDGDQDG